MDVSRREALHRLTMILGGAVSAPTLGAVLSGCRAEPAPPDWVPRAVTPEQGDLLAVLVERIIPATDTPGARQVGAHVFIDKMMDGWAEPEWRDRFLAGLTALDAEARTAHGAHFVDAPAEWQDEVLRRLDAEAARARDEDVDPLPFFARLKEWTLVGYYTSEVGATQELQWLAAPGRYDGDAPLEEVGRTWA